MSKKETAYVPIEVEKPGDKVLKVLFWTTLGLTQKEVAGNLNKSPATVKRQLDEAHTSLSNGSSLTTILKLIYVGWLDFSVLLPKLISDSTIEDFNKLSEDECKMLDELIHNFGINSTNSKIAQKLHKSDQLIKNTFTRIFDKLGTKNRIQTAVLALGYASIIYASAAFINEREKKESKD